MADSNNIIPVVVGIIQHGDRFLVAERPQDKPYSGYWEFPGGKVEEGEDGLTAIKRELHEELGIIVHAATLWRTHLHAYPDKTVNLSLWRITRYSGEPHSKENQTLQFATIAEMQALKLLEGNVSIMSELALL